MNQEWNFTGARTLCGPGRRAEIGRTGLWAAVIAVLVAAVAARAAPITGRSPFDPALAQNLGTSIGQLTESGGTYSGEISPAPYQPYANGSTNSLPILVALYSTDNAGGTNNAVFKQPGTNLTFNGGSVAANDANIGATGSETPNLNTYTPGFNVVNFYDSSRPEFQNGKNTGILVLTPAPFSLYNTQTTLTDAQLSLPTFFVESFAVGRKLDVFVVNPALGLTPEQVTYNALATVPEPTGLVPAAALVGLVLLRRRAAAVG